MNANSNQALASLTLWRYRLPLREPLALGPCTLSHREGLLLEWQGEQQPVIWSEISPLPGFSGHDLENCTEHLKRLLQAPGTLKDRLDPGQPGLPAEVRFGLESGHLQGSTPLPDARPLPRCRLLRHDADLEVAPHDACIKLKVGRASAAEDARRIQHVSRQLRDGQQLRLDANRSWTLDTARDLSQRIDHRHVAFIEEPLLPGSDYAEWFAATGLPLAWDETLREIPPEAVEDHLNTPGLAALVIKPMLTGLGRAEGWVRAARARGLDVVLSAAYESNLTLDLYARLAVHWGLTGPQGLDTFDPFTHALIEPNRSQPEHADRPVLGREHLHCLGHWT
ncbi:o-succinylbenzoate synthase [Ectothiorhodospira variabilis]|uniref:o-succinylbenzoate synthase n=1 Tax=Ectothiorhodospira variabilis TaxID=505694 RepID=UPI001EFBD284|nr:o-succinylbenzoate synthase [Ectothiorhodospira variabilis]MCG5495795.1 o-succinylbenzoate synthase [Ectothiorhodospira variabilis]MCG5504771.1 o-succinylbenzoate synthase [Ectothiorhodospira variabilis]MCG5507928.1 o-succinylbenzoate synthase [Ectothiorhodospira variabilis]